MLSYLKLTHNMNRWVSRYIFLYHWYLASLFRDHEDLQLSSVKYPYLNKIKNAMALKPKLTISSPKALSQLK